MSSPSKSQRTLRVLWLGRRPYGFALDLQERLHAARREGTIGDTLLLLEHTPVITEGRGANPADRLASPEILDALGVEVFVTGRGGAVTLHAPGQLVAYPIFDLSPDRQDVRRYVRNLTSVMQAVCAEYGIAAGLLDEFTGLWADAEKTDHWDQGAAQTPVKLGAIGVRISRWVTMHGFALNLSTDLTLFGLIVPCGIREHGVASVEQLAGRAPSVEQAARLAASAFGDTFDAELLGMEDLSSEGEEALVRHALAFPVDTRPSAAQ